MLTRKRKLCAVIFLLFSFISLFSPLLADENSTFLKFYEIDDDFFDVNARWTENILINHDGNFLLQGNAHYCDPEDGLIWRQPQYLTISPEGELIARTFDDYDETYIVNSLVKAQDGYFACINYDGGSFIYEHGADLMLFYLNQELELTHYIDLDVPENFRARPKNIIKKDDEFLILGYIRNTSHYETYSAAWLINEEEELIWSYIDYSAEDLFLRDGIFTEDSGFLIFNNSKTIKLDEAGNQVWIKIHGYNTVDDDYNTDIIEFNPNTYIKYVSETGSMDNSYVDLIKFTDNYTVIDSVRLDIDPYMMFGEDINGALMQLDENSFILACGTRYSGQLHKYDSAFNSIWHTNNFPNENDYQRYTPGHGTTPMILLPNNDILFTAHFPMSFNAPFALVRTNNQGQVVSIDDNIVNIPNENLSVYPNPISLKKLRNKQITIDYTLSKKGRVNLALYNIKGQLIEKIQNEGQEKGEHTLTWNNSNKLSSGIYFIILKNNSKIINSKKISIIN